MKTRFLIIIGLLVIAVSFMVVVFSEPELFGLTKPYAQIGEYDGTATGMTLMISEQCLEQEQNPSKKYDFVKTSNGHYYIDNVICERINVQQGGCLEPFSTGYPDETCNNRVTFDSPYGETGPYFSKEFCSEIKSWEPTATDTVENKRMHSEWLHICTIRGLVDDKSEPEIFRHGNTKFVNPNYEHLKYHKTTQVIDDIYLGKNVQQWQDAWDWELKSNYEIYKDEFYEELGKLLVKNEIIQVMNQVGIVNANDDITVHQGYSLLSLPPHVGFTSVINATDGNSYLVEASSHSNRVSFYAITQLTFFDTSEELSITDIIHSLQQVHIYPEDENEPKSIPSVLIIHVDDNAVHFVNNTPETIRIQESGTGEIAREHELAWIGPTIPPFENGQMIFDKPGIYEWDARIAPTLENPSWWDSHTGGDIVVLADDVSDLPLEDKLRMGRAILQTSEIPTSGMGVGNADNALKVGLRSAVYEMLPDAVQYYQDRAEQLVPFDIPIIIENPYRRE